MKLNNEDLHLIFEKTVYTDKDGYAFIKVKGKNLYIHRLVMKAPKGSIVDHINGDITDNQKSNLRLVTPSQNSANRRKVKGSTSPYKGVYLDKRYYKDKEYVYYTAKVKKDTKVVFKKSFKDELEAAKWYDEKAKEVHGEYTKLNFPVINE